MADRRLRAAWIAAHPVLGSLSLGAAWGVSFFALASLWTGEATLWRLLLGLAFGVSLFGPFMVLLSRRRHREAP